MNVYGVLEIPWVYRVSQAVLAPGGDRIIAKHLSRTFAHIPTPATVLDVGCGPTSRLWKFGMKPLGLDLCHAYTRQFRDAGSLSVTASAALLPFPADSFDLVFSASLLHHLPDSVARETVGEIVRITRPGGQTVLFDPVLPEAAWMRPQAWALCKLDRGRFIRSQRDYESCILGAREWKTFRFTHSYLGAEGVLTHWRKIAEDNLQTPIPVVSRAGQQNLRHKFALNLEAADLNCRSSRRVFCSELQETETHMVGDIRTITAGISVLVPVFNSELSLADLIARLDPVLCKTGEKFEAILVNDGSRDASWDVIGRLSRSHNWIRGIDLMRNYGQHNALLCAIRAARFDKIVTLDDDLQNPPEEIPLLLEQIQRGGCGLWLPPTTTTRPSAKSGLRDHKIGSAEDHGRQDCETRQCFSGFPHRVACRLRKV